MIQNVANGIAMKNKEFKSSPHQEGKFYFVKLDFSFGKTRRIMLKISLKQGQYVNIGPDIAEMTVSLLHTEKAGGRLSWP